MRVLASVLSFSSCSAIASFWSLSGINGKLLHKKSHRITHLRLYFTLSAKKCTCELKKSHKGLSNLSVCCKRNFLRLIGRRFNDNRSVKMITTTDERCFYLLLSKCNNSFTIILLFFFHHLQTLILQLMYDIIPKLYTLPSSVLGIQKMCITGPHINTICFQFNPKPYHCHYHVKLPIGNLVHVIFIDLCVT